MPTPDRAKVRTAPIISLSAAALMCSATLVRALEVLTVHDLVAHCDFLVSQPQGLDGQHCIRYIQGFIDGAVETDQRIMQNLALSNGGQETLSQSAVRTRMPRRGVNDLGGNVAGFCLGDPLPLREVVDTVVGDLVALDTVGTAQSPARVAVDDSLRRHYPCSE